MAKRAEAYNSDVAKNLRNPKFAYDYMQSLIYNHDASFKEALAEMIDTFGQVEFAERSDIKASNVSRIVERLRTDEDIKEATLENLLSVFGLTLTIGAKIADHKKLKEA